MHSITLVSTVHKEIGNCNADELCKIIRDIGPEVIFLEALEGTYSVYQKSSFFSFGVYHEKLEISAIQKSSTNASFVPVLDIGLSDAFERKYSALCKNSELQKLTENFNFLTSENGFKFLNSAESIRLQEEMRMLEASLLNGSELSKAFNEDIDAYENSMIRNIYSYCKKHHFETAMFMCGVAHRKSITRKIVKCNGQEEIKLKWTIFGT